MRKLINEGGHRALAGDIMLALRDTDWSLLCRHAASERTTLGEVDEVLYDAVVIREQGTGALVMWTWDELDTVTIL
jgi:hypothetical protein